MIDMEMIQETNTIEQKESIKLIKNTKGYNWEIRILSLEPDKLEELNNKMKEKFENEVSG